MTTNINYNNDNVTVLEQLLNNITNKKTWDWNLLVKYLTQCKGKRNYLKNNELMQMNHVNI